MHRAGMVRVVQAWTMSKSPNWRVRPRHSPDHCFVPAQAGAEQSTRIAGLEQERDSLSQAAERHGEEMAALRAELQQLRDTLSHEQESSKMELEMLQTQLRDKVPQGHRWHGASRYPPPCRAAGVRQSWRQRWDAGVIPSRRGGGCDTRAGSAGERGAGAAAAPGRGAVCPAAGHRAGGGADGAGCPRSPGGSRSHRLHRLSR